MKPKTRAELVEPLYIIFDGPPSHESGRFVEVETADGKSVRAGKWSPNGDTSYWRLGPFYAASPPQDEPTDHLAKPDSRERASNIREMLIACAALAVSHDRIGQFINASVTADTILNGWTNAAATQMPESATTWAGDALPEQTSVSAAAPFTGTITGALNFSAVTTSGITLGPGTTATRLVMGNAERTNIIAANPAARKLLLSAEQIRPLRMGNHSIYDKVCDQALAALDLEQQVAGLECKLAEAKDFAHTEITKMGYQLDELQIKLASYEQVIELYDDTLRTFEKAAADTRANTWS